MTEPQTAATGLLDRVLCGVDGSPAGTQGLRQGDRLHTTDTPLVLASVATPAAAAHAQAAAELERHAAIALDEAAEQVQGDTETHLLLGDPADCLLGLAERTSATLLALGSHGTGRVQGALAGSVATSVLHRAGVSVLIAREPANPPAFPTRVTVGLDGSATAFAALELARLLERRFNSQTTAIAAAGARLEGTDPAADVHLDQRNAVPALLEAAQTSDLLVLGARGLHGIRALGSVSERIAHKATCSVLIVRVQADGQSGESD